MPDDGKTGSVHDQSSAPPVIGLLELFLLFTQIGLLSFGGGVVPWLYRALVERRGWLTKTEFSSALAIARIVPGVNVVNLAVLISYRVRGVVGASVAVLGLLLGPSLAVITLAIVYDRFAHIAFVEGTLEGAAAAVVGLLIAMGLQSAARLVTTANSARRATWGLGSIALAAATFILIGVLRLPTAPTVLCLAAAGTALAYLSARPSADSANGG